MESEKLSNFKEAMKSGMIENYTKYGKLVPIVFFFIDNEPYIGMIPNELLSTTEGKAMLANAIKDKCAGPNVLAAGIIIEAYGTKLEENADANKEIIEKLCNGKLKVSDMETKQDIIIMIFSTPEGEEVCAYVVDPEKKAVLEEIGGENLEQMKMSGTFSNFFNWNKN